MKKVTTNHVAKVLQSPFDKAFVQVVEFLYQNWQLHKKFRLKSELFAQFGWRGNQYANVKAGVVNVPKKYVPDISRVLVRDYGVSPLFLNTATGPMFSDSATTWLVEEPKEVYGATPENIEYLQKQIAVLKARITALQSENESLKAALQSRTKTRTK